MRFTASHRRSGRSAFLAAGVVALSLVTSPAVAAQDGAQATTVRLLPDLRFAPLKDVRVTTPGTGGVLLRFTTVLMNVGKGPFVVAGTKDLSDPSQMTTQQYIYDTTGAHTTIDTQAVARYSGDGHNHWHIQKMQTFELRPANEPAAQPLTGLKTGFCFFDGRNINPFRTGNPGSPQYFEGGCGNIDSDSIRVGLSVGWADIYPWDIANQWIDITGVQSGAYRLCVTADMQHYYTEVSRDNNQYWADLTLDMTAKTVIVNASGRSACAQPTAARGGLVGSI